VANGDIQSAQDAEHILATYGVDGVMIGRACQGQPWLLGEMDGTLSGRTVTTPRTLDERLAVAMEHARLLCDYRSERVGIKEMRKHLAWYVQGFPGVRAFRSQLTQVASMDDIERILDEIRQPQPYAMAG
jgi:tRNA-dihydrouridine synthase